jgi:hypothetical protein
MAFVCDACAPKPGRYAGEKPERFVGKSVQLGFPTGLEDGDKEHMWVSEVVLCTREGVEERLEGRLDNDPIIVHWLTYGDVIAFDGEEIEDVDGLSPLRAIMAEGVSTNDIPCAE